jgi:precorrin-6B methylase 2
MQALSISRRLVVGAVVSLFAAGVYAGEAAKKDKPFEPTVGQEGKDVVWVPTSQALVNRMLDMAKLTAADVHFDLGSGDGRTVITAAKRGAKATGVEYNPDMVALSKANAKKEGVGEKAVFVQGDIFETDFSKATVITLFLLPELNVKLRPKILAMKPGTRVVSNSFTMGDWQADRTQNVSEKEGCTAYCTAYLWIVPAKVEGKWKLPDGELALTQTYQNVTGTLGSGAVKGKVDADHVTFTAGGKEYSARVNGDTMTGTVKGGGAFTATRSGT